MSNIEQLISKIRSDRERIEELLKQKNLERAEAEKPRIEEHRALTEPEYIDLSMLARNLGILEHFKIIKYKLLKENAFIKEETRRVEKCIEHPESLEGSDGDKEYYTGGRVYVPSYHEDLFGWEYDVGLYWSEQENNPPKAGKFYGIALKIINTAYKKSGLGISIKQELKLELKMQRNQPIDLNNKNEERLKTTIERKIAELYLKPSEFQVESILLSAHSK
ncbi:MAG TPA: hypothetical protein VIK81_01895 [Patescibacteria group bacterium]